MKQILLKCGKLFDGVHEELYPNMEILVVGKRIEKVGRDIPVSEDTEIIDLSSSTVTPGMIDAHVHPSSFDWRTLAMEGLRSSNWKTLAMLNCAQQTLHRGFTTIRVVGDAILTEGYNGFGAIDVRDVIERGLFDGARMKVAPMLLCTPGSHGDMTQPFSRNPFLCNIMQNLIPTLGNGADFFKKAVREQVKYGADFVKIMATGGFGTPNDSPIEQQLSDDELKAIIDTAKEVGTTVTAHAYSSKLVTKLVNMGIDGVEHAAMIDKATADLIAEKDVYVVPTFCPYDEVINMDEEALAKKQPAFRRKLEFYQEELVAGREVIKNSKMRLGYGTDFVSVHQNYESGYEYSAWLRSGMSPFRALKAATSVNAEILQIPDIGIIKPGNLADISAWDRDLMTDPEALLDCAFVMKEGKIFETVSCLEEI